MYVPSDGEASDQFVPQGLGLRDGAQSTGRHLLSVQLQKEHTVEDRHRKYRQGLA